MLFSPSFVSGIVSLYYQSDSEVEQDTELQAWIEDVVMEGFVDVPDFGKQEFNMAHDVLTWLYSPMSCNNNGQGLFITHVQHIFLGLPT